MFSYFHVQQNLITESEVVIRQGFCSGLGASMDCSHVPAQMSISGDQPKATPGLLHTAKECSEKVVTFLEVSLWRVCLDCSPDPGTLLAMQLGSHFLDSCIQLQDAPRTEHQDTQKQYCLYDYNIATISVPKKFGLLCNQIPFPFKTVFCGHIYLSEESISLPYLQDHLCLLV